MSRLGARCRGIRDRGLQRARERRARGRERPRAHGSAVAAQSTTVDSVAYRASITDNNQMGITVTNYGFLGNNFISRSPSMEYPLGTGFEHMVRGGLWIGARANDGSGAFTGVVTGTVDGSQGTSSQAATEFTPAGNEIFVRSALPNDRRFSPLAVSEQDFICSFSIVREARSATARSSADESPGAPGELLWSFSDYQHFIIYHYVIKNIGLPISSVWVGLYSELASGSKRAYSTWPPTGSGNPLGGWYSKKYVAYDDSLRLFREHYCQAQPVPDGCNFGYAPYWVGIKLLGCAPDSVATKQMTLAAWNYEPGATQRDRCRCVDERGHDPGSRPRTSSRRPVPWE
jgi:hypothetical protein